VAITITEVIKPTFCFRGRGGTHPSRLSEAATKGFTSDIDSFGLLCRFMFLPFTYGSSSCGINGPRVKLVLCSSIARRPVKSHYIPVHKTMDCCGSNK
jgi:hypothetical protein